MEQVNKEVASVQSEGDPFDVVNETLEESQLNSKPWNGKMHFKTIYLYILTPINVSHLDIRTKMFDFQPLAGSPRVFATSQSEGVLYGEYISLKMCGRCGVNIDAMWISITGLEACVTVDNSLYAISEKSTKEKFTTVIITSLKFTVVLISLYLFICSLSFLSSAFQLLGGKSAGEVCGYYCRYHTISRNITTYHTILLRNNDYIATVKLFHRAVQALNCYFYSV